MKPLQGTTGMAITVLGTLVIAAVAYGGTSGRLHPAAALVSPSSSAAAPKPPGMSVVPTPPITAPTGLVVIDQDLLDASTGWMLVSDCPLRANPTCHNAVVGTSDGGQIVTSPAQVGPDVFVTDGGAPRTIRFLNRQDGFVYGQAAAYVTHDGGRTWQGLGVPATFVASLTMAGTTVWAATYPCPKGTPCPYEVRSSVDGGRTWSAPQKLPLGFSPENAAAFGSGVLLSSPTTADMEITTDHGSTWRQIKLPCPPYSFRSTTTTADGVELWSLCEPSPDSSGQVTSESLFVSQDSGKTWSQRNLGHVLPGWLVATRKHVALTSSNDATLITHDSGATWSAISVEGVEFAAARFKDSGWAWAIDIRRNLWGSADGGDHWSPIGTLPATLS
ncbi:MAG: hypothetical protein E6J06_11610 [Chloroflexi bacterium]|nr:MAG: hypothetical protein E6J06_11610 [Chloroflexota bacterium]